MAEANITATPPSPPSPAVTSSVILTLHQLPASAMGDHNVLYIVTDAQPTALSTGDPYIETLSGASASVFANAGAAAHDFNTGDLTVAIPTGGAQYIWVRFATGHAVWYTGSYINVGGGAPGGASAGTATNNGGQANNV